MACKNYNIKPSDLVKYILFDLRIKKVDPILSHKIRRGLLIEENQRKLSEQNRLEIIQLRAKTQNINRVIHSYFNEAMSHYSDIVSYLKECQILEKLHNYYRDKKQLTSGLDCVICARMSYCVDEQIKSCEQQETCVNARATCDAILAQFKNSVEERLGSDHGIDIESVAVFEPAA